MATRRSTVKRTAATEPFVAPTGSPLGVALAQRWADPTAQAALAELAREAGASAEAPLLELMAWGQRTHRADPEVLWSLGRSPLRTVLHLVKTAALASATPKVIDAAEQLVWSTDGARRAVAYDPNMPVEVLVALANSEFGPSLVGELGRNANLPSPQVDWVADVGAPEVAAAHARATPALLERLWAKGDERVSEALAGNPVTPAPLLESSNLSVLKALARNPALEPALLRRVAAHPVDDVRAALTRNPSLPADVFEALLKDPRAKVRIAAVSSHAMSKDQAARVAQGADWPMRLALLHCSNAPPAVLEEFARSDTRVDLKWHLARNPNTPVARLTALAAAGGVGMALASNPSTPPAVLESLLHDSEENTRNSALTHPSLPAAVRTAFLAECQAKTALARSEKDVSDLRLTPRLLGLAARRPKSPLPIWRRPDALLEDLV